MSTTSNERVLSDAQRLSDQDLLACVRRLAQDEREATAALIAHLAVLDERRLYLGEGCSSLFVYCTQMLHLSEHAAYARIEAARAARRFPVILEMLSDGSVTLTTVTLLAAHLTPTNHGNVLTAARHKSRREVEDLVAQLRQLPPVMPTIRRLPVPSSEPSPIGIDHGVETRSGLDAGLDARPDARLDDPLDAGPDRSTDGHAQYEVARLTPSRLPTVEPLAPHQYRVQFTASEATCGKLRLAQDLLRHQIPDGDLGEIMDRALTLLVETLAKQKFAATTRSRERNVSQSAERGSTSRYVPAEVKRIVWIRDGGRCGFVAPSGHRCTERGFLEFHHVEPYAAGGVATPENIELRCRAHNSYEAILLFGGTEIPFVRPRLVDRTKQDPTSPGSTRAPRADPG